MPDKIKRALVSVWDKRGLQKFATELARCGIEIISTGGTAKFLKEKGLPVREISDLTGFPELFEGRVKTLHPKVHGGILFRRDSNEHVAQAKKNGVEAIDLVVVNLYPFEQVAGRESTTLQEAIENIDIGGPAMLRAAAKNHQHVAVVVEPEDYDAVAAEIAKSGSIPETMMRSLALKAFARTSSYDAAICRYLSEKHGWTSSRTFWRCALSAHTTFATGRTRARRRQPTGYLGARAYSNRAFTRAARRCPTTISLTPRPHSRSYAS